MSALKLPDLPDELRLDGPVVSDANSAMNRITSTVENATEEALSVVAISGLCGGCKSTLSRNIEEQAGESLIEVALNGQARRVLSLDWLMSVSRGAHKMELLDRATPDSIRADFFRTKALAELIDSIRNRQAFRLDDAYDAEDEGRLSGKMTMTYEPGKKLLVAEGTVAQAATQIALASSPEQVQDRTVSAVNMLVYTDPAVALLNTVKRGVLDQSRLKDPHYAFREFLRFNSLLLPGYVQYDQHSADIIYRPDDINPLMFKALVDFFRTPGYGELPSQFIAMVKAEFQSQDPIIKAQNQHIIAVLKTIDDAIETEAEA